MKRLLSNDSFLNEAKLAKHKPNVVLQILIFVAVFFVTQIAAAIPVGIAAVIKVFAKLPADFDYTNSQAFNDLVEKSMNSKVILVVTLFSTAIATFLTIVYCRCIEKRNFKSMGFVKKNAVKQYFIGVFIGFLMFSICVGICVATGTLKYDGIIIGGNVTFVILFFFGFLFQGMGEEVLMRGYFMTSLSNKTPIVVAILLNSIVFACLHLMNDGVSLLAFMNLILFGVFASVYAIKTNNLWGICAIHSVWNFVQGNFYGILVSGMNTNASIFKFTSTADGELFNGGDFGLEGGLAVTIVLVAATVITLLINFKKNEVGEVMLEESVKV